MSCLTSALNSCPNIQTSLDSFFNTSMTLEAMPFAEFIMSDVNRNGISQAVHPTSGKVKTVELRYNKRILESDLDTNVENPKCVATEKRGDCISPYTIDPTQNVSANQLIEASDVIYNCENNDTYIAGVIARLVDVVERGVATSMSSEVAALTGAYEANVSGVVADQLVVNTLRAGTTDEIAPFTMENIDLAAIQTGYGMDGIFITGGSLLYQYYRRALAGCCSDSGVDIGSLMQTYGKVVTYDKRVASALGSTVSLMTRPGALALIYYTQLGWLDGTPVPLIASNYYKTVIFSPRLNVPMDLIIKDDCGALSVIVTATTKLVSGPTDQFAAGDDYEGVNWVNEIKVTNV